MKTKHLFLLFFAATYFASLSLVAQPDGDPELLPMEELGKFLFFDKIADPDNMSCADCHGPSVGFTGPNPAINLHGAVYRGAVPQRFGNRKPPSAAYATFSPLFQYDEEEGIFFGGNFWDGRATGYVLGNPAADQALGPFLNPVEQNNASKQAVLEQIASSGYAYLWEIVWGEPISYETMDETNMNYDRVGLAIAAYEASPEVNAFTSKFDYYLQGLVELTPQETWGLELFNDEEKGACFLCHPSQQVNGTPPLFTDFTFDNLGVPKNPKNPFYDMDEVYLPNGEPINPDGDEWIDYGLSVFLSTIPEYEELAAENMGKHKVPTLRNVDKRPGKGFPKAYMHNGVFKSLKEVVRFYNTRDVEDWPDPEVPENVNTEELGDLGLSDAEEDAIVAFLGTLSDGYKIRKSVPAGPGVNDPELGLLIGPNPFRNSTQVAVTLDRPAHIELSVYDLSGRQVRVLAGGWQDAGTTSIQFDQGNLHKGIYLLSLKSGQERISRKVIIL